jgi:hypothetical protein
VIERSEEVRLDELGGGLGMFVKFDSWTLTPYSFSKPRSSFWSMY